MAEVDAFAIDEYLRVLVKGARASANERQAVAETLGKYTGTTADYWLAGRIDSRYNSYTTDRRAKSMPYDPFFSAIGAPFVATFNDYYLHDLGVKMDRSHVDPVNDYPSAVADTGLDLAAFISSTH